MTTSATWSENSAYASISSTGYLTASDVAGSDRPCRITASYTYGGTTKTDTHDVTIENVRDLDRVTITGPTQVDERSGANYTCTAYFDDGSSSNVTSSATWSDNSPYASFPTPGNLKTEDVGRQDRSCMITASYTYGGTTKSDMHGVTIKNVKDPIWVEISGPTQVDERSSASYTCMAYFDDGSSSTVTSSASWSENSPYASFTGPGSLKTGDVGGQDRPCQITASYAYGGGTRSDTYDVTIKNLLEGKAAKPDIDPPSGMYPTPLTVEIVCTTAGATIRYTTDGNEPTEISPEYTGPFQISGTPGTIKNLRAKAFKADWLPSDTAQRQYTFPIPGDTDGNGRVDIADFGVLRKNYGKQGIGWSEGDFNGDGRVDIADFGILREHYGETVSRHETPMATKLTGDSPRLVATVPAPGSTASGVTELALTFDRVVEVGGGAVEVYGQTTGSHYDLAFRRF